MGSDACRIWLVVRICSLGVVRRVCLVVLVRRRPVLSRQFQQTPTAANMTVCLRGMLGLLLLKHWINWYFCTSVSQDGAEILYAETYGMSSPIG